MGAVRKDQLWKIQPMFFLTAPCEKSARQGRVWSAPQQAFVFGFHEAIGKTDDPSAPIKKGKGRAADPAVKNARISVDDGKSGMAFLTVKAFCPSLSSVVHGVDGSSVFLAALQ